jgi:DNA-directed RNA polymerase specialized sigma24 family protein
MIVPVTDSSDEALAARAGSGDAAAFETLVARDQRRVFRLACRLTSDTDAPDVLQETFLTDLAPRGAASEAGRPMTWRSSGARR